MSQENKLNNKTKFLKNDFNFTKQPSQKKEMCLFSNTFCTLI